jgi:hypothetical protein
MYTWSAEAMCFVSTVESLTLTSTLLCLLADNSITSCQKKSSLNVLFTNLTIWIGFRLEHKTHCACGIF